MTRNRDTRSRARGKSICVEGVITCHWRHLSCRKHQVAGVVMLSRGSLERACFSGFANWKRSTTGVYRPEKRQNYRRIAGFPLRRSRSARRPVSVRQARILWGTFAAYPCPRRRKRSTDAAFRTTAGGELILPTHYRSDEPGGGSISRRASARGRGANWRSVARACLPHATISNFLAALRFFPTLKTRRAGVRPSGRCCVRWITRARDENLDTAGETRRG